MIIDDDDLYYTPMPIFTFGFVHYNILESTGKIQYRITSTKSRLQQFAGLTMGLKGNYEHFEITTLTGPAYDQIKTYKQNDHSYVFIAGISYLASYQLTKNIKLQGALAYIIQPGNAYRSFSPTKDDYGRTNVQFGLGYSF